MEGKVKGSLTIVSILLILVIGIGAVSALDNDTISIADSANQTSIYDKHFEDVQKQIDNATAGDEIILNEGLYTPSNKDIDTYEQINVKKSINITGVKDRTIFNAQGMTGIFHAISANHVVFKNITFTGSIQLSAVVVTNSNVDFIDCVFDSNQGSVGGALNVYADEKDITINVLGCDFKNNGAGMGAAGVGGAIALGHYDSIITTNIKNSYFFNNIAIRGGAIYVPGADDVKSYLNIDNTTFKDNRLTLQDVDYVEISGCDIGFWGGYKYCVNITNSKFMDSFDDENPYALALLLLGEKNNLENNTFKNSKIYFEKTDATVNGCNFSKSTLGFYNDPNEYYLYDSSLSSKSADINYNIDDCSFSDSSMVVGGGIIRDSNFTNSLIYKNSQKSLKFENCNFTNQSTIRAFTGVELLNTHFDENSANIKMNSIPVNARISKLSTVTYNSGKKIVIIITDMVTGELFSGVKLKIKDLKTKKTYYATTNKNGRANLVLNTRFAVGTHNLEINSANSKYGLTKVKKTVKVTKAKTTVKVAKVTAKVKKSKYFKVTVKDKTIKKAVKNVKVKIKVGKKNFNVKTNSKGVAQINTKSLKVGTHKVVVSSGNSNYVISAKSTIVIKR